MYIVIGCVCVCVDVIPYSLIEVVKNYILSPSIALQLLKGKQH